MSVRAVFYEEDDGWLDVEGHTEGHTEGRADTGPPRPSYNRLSTCRRPRSGSRPLPPRLSRRMYKTRKASVLFVHDFFRC